MSNSATQLGPPPTYPSVGSSRPLGAWRHKRRRILIDRPMQFRFAADTVVMLMLLVVPGLLTLHVITELLKLQRVDVMAFGTFYLYDVSSLWAYVVLMFLCLVALVVYISVRMSHRIAGPAWKLRRRLEDMAAGDLDSRVRLRKLDHLTALADAVNGASEQWGTFVLDVQDAVLALRSRPEISPAVMDEHCRHLESLLARYTAAPEPAAPDDARDA